MALTRLAIKQTMARIKLRLSLAVLFLLVVLSIFLAYPSQVTDAVRMATTRLPEGYSELSFVDQTHLPVHVLPGVEASFRFNLTNLEGETQNYQYVVTEITPQTVAVIAEGQVNLANGESFQKSIGFKLAAATPRAQFVVSLDGRVQQINFRTQS
jgi:hypothetical protein